MFGKNSKEGEKGHHILMIVLVLLITISVLTTALVSLAAFKLSIKAGHSWKTKQTLQIHKADYSAKIQAMADMTFEEYKEMMDKKVLYFQDQADATQAKITQENFEEWQKSYLEKDFEKKYWHWKK